jgi:hypothetical protein
LTREGYSVTCWALEQHIVHEERKAVLAVAFLLLPGLGLLLFVMAHIEDRLLQGGSSRQGPRPRYLRLIPGGQSTPANGSSEADGHHARRGRHAA